MSAARANAYERCSKTLLGEIFGLDRRTIDKYLYEYDVPASGASSGAAVYSIRDAAPALINAYTVSSHRKLGEEFDPDKLTPKERRDWFESERVRQIVEEKQRLLVSKDSYRDAMAGAFKIIATGLDTLPDLLERECGLGTDVVIAIEKAVDKFRNGLADQLVDDDAA